MTNREENVEKFLRPDNHITFCGDYPVDMNDREHERTAVELSLPDSFSQKAKVCFHSMEGTAFIFAYNGKLVLTDESLWLTEYGEGTFEAPYGWPRWTCDSWEEMERSLEDAWDDMLDAGMDAQILYGLEDMTEYEKLAFAEKDCHTIEIRERASGKTGVANTCTGGVAVFYGKDDGSDDRVISPEEFSRDFEITALIRS